MNLFVITIWMMALLPLAGHLFCLWSLRGTLSTPARRDAYVGLSLGLLIVVANFVQLYGRSLPSDPLTLSIAMPGAAIPLAIAAIFLMYRSREVDVQSIGITGVIVSLFSMASIVALGSLTMAG